MPSIPPSAYQVTSPSRISRPATTQHVSLYKPTSPFRTPPPPPPAATTQPVSLYKPTSPFKTTPPPSGAGLGRAAKFFAKVPKGGAAALTIAIELFFPPPAGDNYYDRNPKNPPPKYKLHPPEPAKVIQPPNYPFRGGQSPVTYQVLTQAYHKDGYVQTSATINCRGPIMGFVAIPDGGNSPFISWYLQAYSLQGTYQPQNFYVYGWRTHEFPGSFCRIFSIIRVDGLPDNGGDPPPTAPEINSSSGNSLGAPSAAPPSAAPAPAPTAPPPSTAPAPAPKPKPNSPGDAPEPNKYPGPVPAPAPAPGDAPQPNKYPGGVPNPNPYPAPNGEPAPSPGTGVGAPSPSPTPAPAPSSFNSGNKAPAPAPGTSPSIKKNPAPLDAPSPYPDTGFQPDQFSPNPLVDNPLEPKKFAPNPNTGNPEPNAPPKTNPPKTPAPAPTPNDDLFKQIQNLIGPVTIALAGITGLVQPNALRSAANAGTCDAFAPGGCNAPIANNAQAAANNSAKNNALLANLLAFLEALQAAFLIPIRAGVELINTKLGPVMAGVNGIGGFLARTAEAAKIDKVLNAMNTILLLHNAAMLSRNLGSTLGDLTSQALATIGIKDGDSPIDVNEILGKQANSFMENLVGAQVWAGTKTSWNKASSIISSATNIMYTVRSMFDSTREILEWTAENTGKIGNALKRFRVVGENAYKWLPERVTVQNRFTRQVDRFREGVDELDDAASSLSGVLGEVQSIQQEYADLQEQKQKFDKNITDLTPKSREENKPVSDAVTAAKNASKAPTEIENVFRGEGEKTDA